MMIALLGSNVVADEMLPTSNTKELNWREAPTSDSPRRVAWSPSPSAVLNLWDSQACRCR